MADVQLTGLRKVFPGGVVALDGLDLTVADGELLVLVGPSGGGKSTVLRLLAGLETPTAGTVRVGGRDLAGVPPHRRDLGYVFQRPALYPHLSVLDNLSFGLRLQRPPWWRRLFARTPPEAPNGPAPSRRVAEAADLLGLAPLLNRRPAELSGGEQQRVALGRALARRPGVLLLDEPLSSLEAPLRREMRRQLHLLRERLHATMLYVTHDQEEAMTLGDRVAVLDRGSLRQVGPPLDLYHRPADRFVAGFLGWPPMSFLEGRLVADGDKFVFRGPDAALDVPGDRLPVWRRFADGDVLMGVRAEHVSWADGGAQEGLLTMRVDRVERLGGVSLLRLSRGGWRLLALHVGPGGPARDDRVRTAVDLGRASVFDPATGRALAHPGTEG
jgi:multiple sugar transport system ATP-binding protein